MAYVFLNGKRVSPAHNSVLRAYHRKYGVWPQVNQGARTLAEQNGFWQAWLRFRRVLAARPFPGAPHIKYGRQHHALDINAGSGRGQAQHVAAFYRSLGVPVAFNVPREPWHMDTLDEAALKRAAARVGGGSGEPTLRKSAKPSGHVIKLKKLLYNNGIRDFSGPPSKPNSNRYSAVFGTNTKKAVARFQRQHGLSPDGVVGPATWRKLRA